jgi:hypothetical protein
MIGRVNPSPLATDAFWRGRHNPVDRYFYCNQMLLFVTLLGNLLALSAEAIP